MKKFTIIMLTLLLTACATPSDPNNLRVVTTTTMITDLTKTLAEDTVEIQPLMQNGIDPHSFKAKESDVLKLLDANLVIYNGIHLEAKLVEIFEKLDNTVSLEQGLSSKDILISEEGGEDPHIWFSIDNWKKATRVVGEALIALNPKEKNRYEKNIAKYLSELDTLSLNVEAKISELPKEKRVLVTAHDAFNYFANEHGFEVMAIQGISSEAEASTNTVSKLAETIATNKIKAVFTESSISPKTVQALTEAVRARGFDVKIGPELYSDSLKLNGTYLETYMDNVNNIVDSLK